MEDNAHRDTHVVQNDQRLGPSTFVVTDGVENTVVPEGGDELLDKQNQQDTTDDGQDQVVQHEQSVQLEGLHVLHDLTATEDDHIVGDEDGGGLFEGGEGCHALLEVELASRVSSNQLKGLVEDGP